MFEPWMFDELRERFDRLLDEVREIKDRMEAMTEMQIKVNEIDRKQEEIVDTLRSIDYKTPVPSEE